MLRFAKIILNSLILCLATTSVLMTVEPSAASSTKFIHGPVTAQLINVVDGDTVLVDAEPWPNTTIRIFVRLRDIDTPEMKSKCVSLRKAAKAAKIALSELLDGQTLTLHNISGGKYYGRIIADIQTEHGTNASQTLLNSGHTIPYKSRKLNRICRTNS